MVKKRLFLSVILFVAAIIMVFTYWSYFSPPASFPTNSQLVKEMNQIFPNASVRDIQETVHLDKRNTVVPFVSDQGNYGVSYWQWKKHKWQVMSIETKGEPRLWKSDPNDPSTYYLVWNWDPNDQLSYVNFYFVRDRGYSVSDGIATYKPKIQMVKRINLKGQTFGVLKVPSDWAESMKLLSAESMRPTSMMNFSGRFSDQQSYFGYTPYDKEDKLADIMNSVNGNAYTTENSQIEFLRLLEEHSIEVPKH